MSEQQAQSKVIPFVNNGINQVVDESGMQLGDYYYQSNVFSLKDGGITTRSPWKKLSQIGSASYTQADTITKLRVDDTTSYYYIKDGENILRGDLTSTVWSAVATGVDSIVGGSDAVFKRRMSSVAYSAGTSGEPYMYFATPLKMLKDYGESTYASLRSWGIFPPTRPVQATLAAASAVTLVGSATAYATVTSTATTITNTTVGFPINLGQFNTYTPSGSLQDFYESDDYIAFAFTMTNLSDTQRLQEIKIELDVSGTAGDFVDTYFKAVVPSGLTDFLTELQTAIDAGYEESQRYYSQQKQYNPDPYSNYSDYSHYYGQPPDPYVDFPASMNALPSVTSPATISDTVRIAKSDFGKTGEAGTASKNWSSVKALRVTAIASASDASGPQVKLVSAIMLGGNGPNATAQTARPYRYCYTYRDPLTGHESNPSVPMVIEKAITPQKEPVSLTLYGTTQTGIGGGGSGTIAIYRSGGTFADSEYRFLGYAAAPSTLSSTVVFTDRFSDVDISGNRWAEYDNDPPVLSTLPVPFLAAYSSTALAGGMATISATVVTPSGSDIDDVITVGSTLYVEDGSNSESVIVEAVGASTIAAFFQRPHSSAFNLSCNAVAGKACALAVTIGDAIFTAGDSNSPSTLYKSKTGRPESFPTVTRATRAVNQITVGSPSNPIMNICEYNGEVVCMNLNNFYTVRVVNGFMDSPRESSAQRGLYSRWAWCKGDGQIFYLAHDGVYAWAGGLSRKISGKIDHMFRSILANGIYPVDYAYKQYIHFSYFRNKLYIAYQDTGGARKRLVYDLARDAWFINSLFPQSVHVEEDVGRMLVTITDVAGAIIGQDDTYGTAYTTDGYTAADGSGGTDISWSVRTPFYDMGMPTVRKQFTDFILELTKPSTAVSVLAKVFLDYNTTAVDTFTISSDVDVIRDRISLPIYQTSSPTTSYGREGHAVAFEFSSTDTDKQITLHNMTFNYIPLEVVQRGRIMDWSDLGHPWDKKLKTLNVDYDAKSQTLVARMDALIGISGNTETISAESFTLTGRGQQTFPIAYDTPVKKVRLRLDVPSSDFLLFGHKFDFEPYPADSIYYTEFEDCGYPYEKRFRQLFLRVDTASQAVPLYIEGDGGTIHSTTITSSSADAAYEVPVPVDIVAKQVRLKVGTIPAGGKFQLFNKRWDFEQYPQEITYATDYEDCGYPHEKRFSQLFLNVNTNSQAAVFVIYGDGSAKQTCTATSTLADRAEEVPIAVDVTAKQVRLQVTSIPATGRFQLFGKRWEKEDYPPDITYSTDYEVLDTPYEKHFTQLYLNVNTNNKAVVFVVDGDGAAMQTCTATSTISDRAREIPVDLDITAKQVRLRVTSIPADGKFQLFGKRWEKENYPPAIVYSTEYNDFGYDYDKYVQQLLLKVNTNSQAVPFVLYADGTAQQTLTATSTLSTRDQILTLNPAISAKMLKIVVPKATIPANGRFQLWDFKPVFNKVDEGPVYHTFPYSDLGYPYDKKLKEVTIHHYTNGSSYVVALDTISGINGNTVNTVVQTFTISSTVRGYKTFPVNETVCKMARIRSLGVNGGGTHSADFKMWMPNFDYDKYPPDITPFTEYTNLGWGCDKIFRGLNLDVDTGSVAAVVNLQVDGTTKDSWTITSSSTTRGTRLTPNVSTEIAGKLYRITDTVGTGGKFQLFAPPDFEVIRDACESQFWDSFEQAFGSVGYRYIKEMFIDYKCASTITLRVYNESGQLVHTETLPAHTVRSAERFYLPAANASTGYLNKSKKHRITMTAASAATPFKLYRDSSRVMVMFLSGDARKPYTTNLLWEALPLQA